MIKIFKKDETDFSHDGIEVLDDIVISSYTDWSEENKWIIQAKFKKDFDKSESIKEGLIIQVPTEKGEQLFRILKINKKNRKYISISGHAIGYDFNDNFIQDINIIEKSGRAAIKQISSGTVYGHKYNLTSNIDRVASARMVRKNGVEALIGSSKDNTFIERWGGYLVLDNFNISMNESIGQDRGVEIAIGKNVTGYDGDIDEEAVCTGINAITYDGLTLPEGVYYSPLVNNYAHPKIREFKFDDIKYKYSENNYDEEGYETLEEVYEALRKACDDLFNVQNIDKPTCSLRVNIAALENTDQYKGDELTERIFQGDILTANLDDYGFNVKLKMIANRYDNVRKRYIDIDLGDEKNNLFKDISKIESVVDKVVEQLGGNSWQDILDKSMKEATELIAAGIKDSYVVARKNEILIMDSPLVESAVNVIRMNKNGIAFSQSGYNGPYTLAITIDGKINASCIVTGELNAALIKAGIIMSKNGKVALSIDDDYIQVTHDSSLTKTRIDGEGFYILDEEGETIASLASKESWTELNVQKVFATNIENIYLGDANLYVDHTSTNNIKNGSIDYPFTCFDELMTYLNRTKIINKNLIINIITSGVVTDRLSINGFRGNGYIDINFNKDFVLRWNEKEAGIYISYCDKVFTIRGGRTSYNSNDGARLSDILHGIECYYTKMVKVYNINIDARDRGCYFYNTNFTTARIDFGNTPNGIVADSSSVGFDSDSVGNCTNAYYVTTGAILCYGSKDQGGYTPLGLRYEMSGKIHEISSRVATGSFREPPVIPPTNNYNKSFGHTSLATYQYAWSNWKSGECKQGSWGYGLRGGHIFFDMASIRSFLSGTVLDGNTITLTRRNAGGNSGATNVYINGSTCSGASGTPSYSNQTLLGSLKWNETKTFTLPKSIVQALKNGTCNSIAVYVGTSDYSNYIEITSASINLKVNK